MRTYEIAERKYDVIHVRMWQQSSFFYFAWATPKEELPTAFPHPSEKVQMPLGELRRPSDEAALALLLGEPVVIQ